MRGFGWQRRFCVALAYRFHTPVSQAFFSGTGFEGVIGLTRLSMICAQRQNRLAMDLH